MHGEEASEKQCGALDERDDKARCPASPVPSGAGGGLRMTAVASLERRSSLPSVGHFVLLARRYARDRALFGDRLLNPEEEAAP